MCDNHEHLKVAFDLQVFEGWSDHDWQLRGRAFQQPQQRENRALYFLRAKHNVVETCKRHRSYSGKDESVDAKGREILQATTNT